MADTRIIHRKLGGSAKVSSLCDFEYRVWTQYILSADDYGVMPATAFTLQADNLRLRRETTTRVQEALETVIGVSLIAVFVHQTERFVWQPDWQDWQHVKWPRKTVLPAPEAAEISTASKLTRKLFRKHSPFLRKFFGSSGEILSPHSHARNTSTHTHTDTRTDPDASTGTEPNDKAPTRALLSLFDELHQQHFRVKASLKGAADAKRLADLWRDRKGDPISVEMLMEAFFAARDPFAEKAGYSIGVFVSQVPKLITALARAPKVRVDWIAECEAQHGSRCGSASFHAAKMAEESAAS